MFFVVFILLLLGALVALIFYSQDHIHLWMQPDGPIIQNLIPSIGVMVLEILAVVVVASYLIDRKWSDTRKHILFLVRSDYRFFVAFCFEFSELARAPQQDPHEDCGLHWVELMRHANENELQQQLQYLTPAFNPDLSRVIADYMRSRLDVTNAFRQIDDPDGLESFAKCLVFIGHQYPEGSTNEPQMYFACKALIALEDHLSWYGPLWKEEDDQVKEQVLDLLKKQAQLARKFTKHARQSEWFKRSSEIGVGRHRPPSV